MRELVLHRDDLVRAIKKLKAMGSGFGMIPVGGSYLVQSVPAELNMDHTVVLQLAEVREICDTFHVSVHQSVFCHQVHLSSIIKITLYYRKKDMLLLVKSRMV